MLNKKKWSKTKRYVKLNINKHETNPKNNVTLTPPKKDCNALKFLKKIIKTISVNKVCYTNFNKTNLFVNFKLKFK